MNDKDGKECLKIIDAAGQQIILENNSTEPLDRRGNRTNPPKTASMTLKTNGNLNLICDYLNLSANGSNIETVVGGDKNYIHRADEIFTGDGSTTEYNFKHSLGNQYCMVQVVDLSTNEIVKTNVTLTSPNGCDIIFAKAPESGKQYRIIAIA